MMHLRDIAQKFNISNFIVYCCLLILSILLSLKVDGLISHSYGIIFLPLWVWNCILFIGMVVGVAFWIKKRRLWKEKEQRHHFVAMLQSTLLQFFIFVEEILIAVNLDLDGRLSWLAVDLDGRLSWLAVFTPLFVLSVVAVVACVFSCCQKRCNIELEVLGSVNILQLIFLGLQVDGIVTWRWAVVLIPTWLVLIMLSVLIVLYSCIQCCLISIGENQPGSDLKKPLVVTSVIAFTFSTISFTIFLALLVSQLDGNLSAPYTAIFVPLHISILCLFPTLLTRQPANPLWFGIQKNFTEAVLDVCPFFGKYLNVSWSKSADDAGKLSEISARIKLNPSKAMVVPISVVVLESKDYPYLDIMTPD